VEDRGVKSARNRCPPVGNRNNSFWCNKMSDSRGFDAGDWRVRAHRERAAGSGCGGIRRAYVCVRASVFVIATLIFVAAFGGDAAAQTGIGGGRGGGGGGNNPVPVPAATSDAHRSGQATLFDVGSQFLQRFNAVYSFRTAASAANIPRAAAQNRPPSSVTAPGSKATACDRIPTRAATSPATAARPTAAWPVSAPSPRRV
jgi:hypothetical protein